MKSIYVNFSSAFLLLFITLKASNFCEAQCIPNKPSGLYVSDVTGCSAILHWKSIPNIGYFKIRFKQGEGAWSTSVKIGTDTFYNFSGLNAGMKYSLSVESFCSST